MTATRKVAAFAALSLAAGPGLANPAVADSDWGRPQRISTKYGRDINLSRHGRVAVWIRTNRVEDSEVTGRVRAAWYLRKKQKWSRTRAVPGARKVSDIQVSRNGDHALLAFPDSYAVAARVTRNRWAAPEEVAEGDVTAGFMSEKGNTVGWLRDGTEFQVRTRRSDGRWGPVQSLGNYSFGAPDKVFSPVSGDGATTVRLEASGLVAYTLNPDSTWAGPQTLRSFNPQYPIAQGTESLQVSYKGDAVLVSNPEWFTVSMTRVDGVWETRPDGVVSPTSVAASPSGDVISWTSRDSAGLRVSQWLGATWGSTTVDKVAVDPEVALTNTALTWTRSRSGPSALRASTLFRGLFTKGERLATKAAHPAISFDGRTIAWSDTRRDRLMSIRRQP